MSDKMLKLADKMAGSLGPFHFVTAAERDLIVSALRADAASAEPVAWWCVNYPGGGGALTPVEDVVSHWRSHGLDVLPLYTHPTPDAEIVAANLEQVITRAILAHERLLSGSVGAISQGEANRAVRKAKDIAAALAKAKGGSAPEPELADLMLNHLEVWRK